MKKILFTITAVSLIGIISACGANDNETNDQNNSADNEVTENETNNTEENNTNNEANDDNSDMDENNSTETNTQADTSDMNEKMKDIEFAEIEIKVEYGDDKEYEAEIEKSSTGDYKAEVDDDLNNNHLKGQEAFDHLYPIIEKMAITADSTKEEVFDEVLKAFDLDANYTEIEIEITFQDGKKMEYENK